MVEKSHLSALLSTNFVLKILIKTLSFLSKKSQILEKKFTSWTPQKTASFFTKNTKILNFLVLFRVPSLKSAMGQCQLWDLSLPGLFWQTSGSRRAYQVFKKILYQVLKFSYLTPRPDFRFIKNFWAISERRLILKTH